MKSIERSRLLRARMKSEIFPLIEAHGFQRLKHTGIWYGFTRLQSDQLQVIEFQWDKYHGPKFLVNFGQTPAVIQNDETGFRNHLTQEWLPLNEVTSGLTGSNRIAIGRFHRQWFRYTWLDSLLPSGGPHKAVDRCISYLPLIDDWFAGDPASVAIVDHMNFRPASTRD